MPKIDFEIPRKADANEVAAAINELRHDVARLLSFSEHSQNTNLVTIEVPEGVDDQVILSAFERRGIEAKRHVDQNVS